MNSKELIRNISNELANGRNFELEIPIHETRYKIKCLAPDNKQNINIPSIVLIPLSSNTNSQIILESNNLETGNIKDLIKQGGQTALRLVRLTESFPCTIVVPIIPSYRYGPYFQQLSKECFTLSKEDKNYRIDEQVIRIIEKAREIIRQESGIEADDKIFLNGYSSSGVFAQRFALLHPEIIETACIGGASGSIPIPSSRIEYPIGIADYEELTGKKFDITNYAKIKFRYYVGEYETANKCNLRFDENGNPSPMHDMSYFNRSVPQKVGKLQRKILGTEMFERTSKTIQLLKELGIDIEHTIIQGRSHNDFNGIGVNELGDKFVSDTYKQSIRNKEPNDDTVR